MVEAEGMTYLLKNVEQPLTEVLASMEHDGVRIDADGVRSFGTSLTEMIEETSKMIYDEAGHEFNISSPKQLSTVLFEEQKLDAILCAHFDWNTQSARVQQKCGFHFLKESIYKTFYGTVEKDIINVLYREEWRNEVR